MHTEHKDEDLFQYIDNFAKFKHVDSVKLYGSDEDHHPKVSIIIPTYRRFDLLQEAIASALNQVGILDYEIIVVDNDPDNTLDGKILTMIKEFKTDKLFYYRNKQNIGMFANWNRGIELAKGEWVLIMSDDDLLSDSFLVNHSSFLRDDVDMVKCGYWLKSNLDLSMSFSKKLRTKLFYRKKMHVSNIWHHDLGCTSFIFYRRSKFLELGGMSVGDGQYIGDYLLFMKMIYFGKAIRSKLYYGYYRTEGQNTSGSQEWVKKSTAQIKLLNQYLMKYKMNLLDQILLKTYFKVIGFWHMVFNNMPFRDLRIKRKIDI